MRNIRPYISHVLITFLIAVIIYIAYSQTFGLDKTGTLLYYITKWQSLFNREVALKVKSLHENYSTELFAALLSTSFLYGVLHAAGPGHEKSIITGWILTQPRSFRDIATASLIATFLHAFSAVTVVTGIYLFIYLWENMFRLLWGRHFFG